MALFTTGSIVATPAALTFCEKHNVNPQTLIGRHIGGDWGDLAQADIKANADALAYDDRILSSYNIGSSKVWLITEWDRSYTTILMPEDY
jgi:hypothetical protein